MILHLSAKAAREVEWAIQEIAAGKPRQALKRLCYIRGWPVPDMKRPRLRAVGGGALPGGRTREHSVSQAPGVAVPPHERPRVARERDAEPVTPLPKPAKRHVDRLMVEEFAVMHPGCSLINCGGSGEIDTHHITKRSAGGSDAASNLLRLHRNEHEEFHRIGRDAFAERYTSRLRATDMMKIRLAGRMEAEAKLGTREAVEEQP